MRLAIACAAACLAGGTVQESTDLSFHPAEGSILKKTFEVESSGWIDAIWWDGQDVTSALGSAGITTGITAEARMQVTDEYLRVGDNRPLELLRGFDALRTVWAWRDTSEVLHPLLYRTVCFTWDEDRGDRSVTKPIFAPKTPTSFGPTSTPYNALGPTRRSPSSVTPNVALFSGVPRLT